MKTLKQAIFRSQSQKKETDYAAVYLKKKELKTRQCVYIGRDMHGIVFLYLLRDTVLESMEDTGRKPSRK